MKISKKDSRKLDRLDFAIERYNQKLKMLYINDKMEEYYQTMKSKQKLYVAQDCIVKKYI